MLNISLKRINQIKAKLQQYKSQLLKLESMAENNEKKIKKIDKDINDYKDDSDINENSLMNLLETISVKGDINIEIIINIME